MNQRQSHITVILFCILLFGMTLATVIKPTAEFSETENRVLAQKPQATAETVLSGEFEADYEEYLTDQFVLRDQWIGLKTAVEQLLLKRESKDIYFAEDGYYIEKHTGIFTSDVAQRNLTALAEFARQYEGRFADGRFSVMIVPNAVDILREKLPPFASPYDEEAYLAQIADALPEGVWFDAARILRAHGDEELYYRTDHHWKTLAAFYAYQGWAAARGCAVPALQDYDVVTVTDSFQGTIQSKLGIQTEGDTIEVFLPKEAVSYTVRQGDAETASLYDESALDTKDKYAVYFGGNQGFISIQTDAESDGRILVIKDSYANCFIPFLLEEFKEIDVLDLRYDRQRVSERIENGGYTDLLVLYNAAGFAGDTGIINLTR